MNFESKLSNIEMMSAEADKGCKFESKLSNIEMMSAEADKGCKNEDSDVGAQQRRYGYSGGLL